LSSSYALNSVFRYFKNLVQPKFWRRAAGLALEKSCRTYMGVGLGDCHQSRLAGLW
jgi:hypothetical protein